MNILYIGSAGALSLIPFKTLLSSGHAISAVAIHNPIVFNNKIIALENESLALAASQNEIPVIDLSQPLGIIARECKDRNIHTILMACYSKRLPAQLVTLPANGCFNLHPSLLPLYRGPEPVFWQMKHAADIGVSWHRVTEALDAGAIVAQKKVYLDDGLAYQQINSQLAQAGSDLMQQLLADLGAGRLSATQQDPDAASYYRYPQQDDFVVDCRGSAQQAYNFMRATQVFGFNYLCRVAGRDYWLRQALDYDNNRTLDAVEVQGDRLFIPFNQGVLIAGYAGKL